MMGAGVGREVEGWSFVTNNYFGRDTLGLGNRTRFHSDTSVQRKYYDNPGDFVSKAAVSVTGDVGWEDGDGVGGLGGAAGSPNQYFLGYLVYHRLWFHRDLFGLTLGGGGITNPGRYLVLMPPINGATAASGTPYFTQNPGDDFRAWDASCTLDYMPSQHITWRLEYIHREANTPYFAGSGGITPPGGNTGSPGSAVPRFQPDLTTAENRINAAMMVRL